MLKQNNKGRDIIENIITLTELTRRQDEVEKKVDKAETKLDKILEVLTERTIHNGHQDHEITAIIKNQEKEYAKRKSWHQRVDDVEKRVTAIEKISFELSEYIKYQKNREGQWFNRNTTFYIMILGWAFTVLLYLLKP